jgi:dipeptidyl aminopeptidase/acylaminoacyl peptidase
MIYKNLLWTEIEIFSLIFDDKLYNLITGASMKILHITLTILISVTFQFNSLSQEKEHKIPIKEWLTVGPFKLSLPVLQKDTNMANTLKELLEFDQINVFNEWINQGDELKWDKQTSKQWKAVNAPDGKLNLSIESPTNPEVYFLTTYIEAEQFTKLKLEFSSCYLFSIYLNGDEIISKKTAQNNVDTIGCKPETLNKDINLETGKHILLIKSLKNPDTDNGWDFTASVIIDSAFSNAALHLTTSPIHFTSIKNLLEDPKIGSIAISSDGELAAVGISQIKDESGNKDSWIDIYETKTGNLFTSYKGLSNISSLKWVPKIKAFTFLSSSKEKQSLWIVDLSTRKTEPILEEVKDLSGYTWSPDGSYIIYSITQKPEEDKTGLKKHKDLNDRWPWARHATDLYRIHFPSKVKSRLTGSQYSLQLQSINSNGEKLLLSTTQYEPTERPYSFTTFFILDLNSMRCDSLTSLAWSSSAQFSPEGNKILFLGGPSAFGAAGINLPEGMIPNDYDGQAYIYDLISGNVEAISREFNPGITSAYWTKNGQSIYFSTRDKSFQNLYRYDLKTKKYFLVNLGISVLDNIDFADDKAAAIYKGSSATETEKLFYIDFNNKNSKLLFDPNTESYRYIQVGRTEEWTFQNSRDEDIDGLVYYPPDFNQNRKYPCIVYFYGGTNPVEQSFEGRYPKNLWAAHDYIVYVLQPSGAVGYGQRFSAYHVNDWGKITADEIIKGTKEFLEAHPFVDPARVGCIGASYGGFMTLNILTKTDMFAAAVSHAGISSLASYWGEGYWGYLYSAVATANSFPWNRKDIYVDHSPLYNANKITTPLLLLHGASDTNVPSGESLQMFTALKLLGKEVEFVEVAGQDHHILEYGKRKQWTKTIIAWFDKYLKIQPEWWNSLYDNKKKE